MCNSNSKALKLRRWLQGGGGGVVVIVGAIRRVCSYGSQSKKAAQKRRLHGLSVIFGSFRTAHAQQNSFWCCLFAFDKF